MLAFDINIKMSIQKDREIEKKSEEINWIGQLLLIITTNHVPFFY